MSSQCNHFVQNAWKKELCSNCFKPREEHSEAVDNNARFKGTTMTTKTSKTTKTMNVIEAMPQGILKGKTSSRGKKKVAFPDSLTEVIGYGGDDFSDSEEFELSESSLGVEDDLPDGEEERALCNLTRANTSFNTVTANLSSSGIPDAKKSFASLMLGKPRKDSDGKKKTLLVSVTPFGAGDAVVPTAKRPAERKAVNFSMTSRQTSEVADAKSEVTLKSVNSIAEDKIVRDRNEKEATSVQTEKNGSALEKIVDMPLITSSNLISVIQKSDSLQQSVEGPTVSGRTVSSDQVFQKTGFIAKASADRKTGITRTPAMKKQKDADKPIKIATQGSYKQTLDSKNEYIARTTAARENESYARIEDRDGEPEPKKTWGKDVNTMEVQAADDEEGDNKPDETEAPGSFGPKVSRELAGEPDGKADEEVVEPPALPRSPPPIEPRNSSFLHSVDVNKKAKPTVPQKPSFLPPKAPSAFRNGSCETNSRATGPRSLNLRGTQDQQQSVVEEEETTALIPGRGEDVEDETASRVITLVDVDGDAVRSSNKRRMAPKPPPPTYASTVDEAGGSLFARNPGAVNLKSDSPVVREKEKRERASSCSPKFRKDTDQEAADTQTSEQPGSSVIDADARRMMSLSQDSLANGADKIEEKKKARSRFSLKKFLRMGSKKDQVDGNPGLPPRLDDPPTSPQPTAKPRLEIIHPLELDGAAVEVVSRERLPRISKDQRTDESVSEADQSQHLSSPSTGSPPHHPFARPGKPPPPPRNQSLDDWARLDPANKPARPPPPRTEIKSPSKSWHPPNPTSPDSIYANLGEVRSGLAPSKPQRTASMRDQAICQPPVKKRPAAVPPNHEDYETLASPRSASTTDSSNLSNDNHAYECLSSSPECDSSLDLRHGVISREGGFQLNGKRKSDSSALDPGTDFAYHNQPFTRSTSLPYCGSETESELYSPYSFCTGDEGPEDDQDWKNGKECESRVGRLRQRRGRSIVHRSLEDNYGAVIVANHEALAQVLEQLNQTSGIPPALRGLKTASLRLSDFILDPKSSLPLGRRVFYSASWNDNSVTICVALDLTLHVSRKEFNLVPIIEFTDTIPEFIAEKIVNHGWKSNVEATISVLPHLQVTTVDAFAGSVKDTGDEGFVREASFVLLQLVNAFKNLQARGVEEAPLNLSNAVLCREAKDACYRLYLLQSLSSDTNGEWEEEKASLCQCVLRALQELTLSKRLPLVQELLQRERTASLSQVKSVLEFSLWGPADVTLGGPRDREMTLQRWLDLERATVLHALVRARAPLAVTDEYHLLFLVRTSAKIMCEASMLLDAQRRK
ncbi:uncharacterized protein LOC124413706 isoform X2 [Diprion similis]|uniref:uncharacterized protein LOC124413706 isoform X2 n=1 Tax=Diprion similis TaxID=362088 RepID=UPI001EF76D0E|nr:uncharacterized protein LOC124413706 isoform X2 [Diprion similis]